MKILAMYHSYPVLFNVDSNAGALIEALSNGIPCRQRFDGKGYVYEVDTDSAVDIQICKDDDVRLPSNDNPQKELLDKIVKLSSELSEQRLSNYKLQDELKKLRDGVKAISVESK